MNKYWSDVLKRLEPYVPGEQPKDKKYIKLNTNENPYPPSPRAIEAIRQAADERLRLYPDPDCDELKHVLAENLGVKKEQVFVGNGSDEVLAFSFAAFFNPGEPILFPDITYTFYPVYCQLYGIDYRTIPLDADFNIPVEGFLQDNGGIIFANPNAPTGKFMDLASVEKIVKENIERVVVIDEAYVDFGGQSAVKLIDKYPNLLVIKTLSKSHSLAGLRIGFALGNAGLIEGLDRVKNSFNSYTIDRIALRERRKPSKIRHILKKPGLRSYIRGNGWARNWKNWDFVSRTPWPTLFLQAMLHWIRNICLKPCGKRESLSGISTSRE